MSRKANALPSRARARTHLAWPALPLHGQRHAPAPAHPFASELPALRADMAGRTTVMDGLTPATITSHHPTATKGKHTVDFAVLEVDGNVWLSRAEADPNATLRMDQGAADRDRDGDGRLIREEFDDWTPGRR